MLCEYPDCDEGGEYYCVENNGEVAACDDHIDWALNESKQRPNTDCEFEFNDDPYSLLNGLLETIERMNTYGISVKQVFMQPKIFDIIIRHQKFKFYSYRYIFDKNVPYDQFDPNKEVQMDPCYSYKGVIFSPAVHEQDSPFYFDIEIKPHVSPTRWP